MVRARVRRTIEERRLLSRGDHVLVACSGGPDSTVLLHVLHAIRQELGITLCVASVDHGLRPASAMEVEAVGVFAKKLELPFEPLSVSIEPGASVQARARTARYGALQAAAAEARATRIAVGHTRDDQAETVLSRLLRGAGVLGLAGIRARRDDGVIRPLLDCLHSEVVEYARFHGLTAHHDPSNDDEAFERVRLRKDLIPLLEREDPKIVSHLAALADEAEDYRQWVHAELSAETEPGLDHLSKSWLLSLPKPVATAYLMRWLAHITGKSPGRDILSAVFGLLTASGEVLVGSGWVVRPVGEDLSISREAHRKGRSSGPDRL